MPAWTSNSIILLANASGAAGAASVNAWLVEANPFVSLALAAIAAVLGVAANTLRNPAKLSGAELAGRYIVGVAVGIFFYVAVEEQTHRRAWLILLAGFAAFCAEAILPKIEAALIAVAVNIARLGDQESNKDER